jgi:nuclear polyadenylated RNA-binding protein NAB2
LPTSFHRGLSTSAPLVTVPNPEPGSIGAPSPHKSVTFNQPGAGIREKLQKQMKEIEEKKTEAEKAVKEAEAAAAAASGGKKDNSKPVPIAV